MSEAAPIPVIPLEYAEPTKHPRRRRWSIVAQAAMVLSALDVLVGWVLITLVDAETVIVTAPVLFVLGLILLVASRPLKLLLVAILGLAHCSICLLFTMLVNVLNWSPNEATMPFTIMTGLYLIAVVLPVTAVAMMQLRRMTPAALAMEVAPGGDLPATGRLAEDKP
jgi:hypothetical protein